MAGKLRIYADKRNRECIRLRQATADGRRIDVKRWHQYRLGVCQVLPRSGSRPKPGASALG